MLRALVSAEARFALISNIGKQFARQVCHVRVCERVEQAAAATTRPLTHIYTPRAHPPCRNTPYLYYTHIIYPSSCGALKGIDHLRDDERVFILRASKAQPDSPCVSSAAQLSLHCCCYSLILWATKSRCWWLFGTSCGESLQDELFTTHSTEFQPIKVSKGSNFKLGKVKVCPDAIKWSGWR
jgi:hypothetical protein